ncbi:unnamed protein product [Chironomus riparius]|uniref:Uncharacterized protein n=1 Tax=Chironomus riparius TaxID=315576 RepID=A0A9N9RV26_9DIPT|nr:unnamed protein product [Chironomus riparius]
MYGCVVWWHKMKQVFASQKIEKLQRKAELSICGAWTTTPKLALDRFLEPPPLRVRIEAAAQTSASKLNVNKLWVNDWISTDHMELNRFLRSVVVSEDNAAESWDLVDNNCMSVCTDASKSESGVGIGLFSNDLSLNSSYKLQDHAFQQWSGQ